MSFLKRMFKLLGYACLVCAAGFVPIGIYIGVVFVKQVAFADFLNLEPRTFIDIAIIVLAIIIIAVAGTISEDDFAYKQGLKLTKREAELNSKAISISKKESDIFSREVALKHQKEEFRQVTESLEQTYPWLAQQVADYWLTKDNSTASYLRHKSHPAVSAAQKVSEIAQEKRTLQKQCKMYEYQLDFLREALPWLDEYMTIEPNEAYRIARGQVASDEESYEKYKNWLSPQEYATLSTAEKYQRALDRYIKQPKNDWEAGIIYERYVGYRYEASGYKVEYWGATRKKEDMGRDLVATKGKSTLVIQCKRYRAEKEVHENTVFQTYGTAIMYQIEHPEQTVRAVVVTTAKLSGTAKECADYLKIGYREEYPLETYPLIKCNISKTGEKIYHLPFDQQYDNIRLNPKDGDCYAHTVAEAEKLGFRHAFRWKGTSQV